MIYKVTLHAWEYRTMNFRQQIDESCHEFRTASRTRRCIWILSFWSTSCAASQSSCLAFHCYKQRCFLRKSPAGPSSSIRACSVDGRRPETALRLSGHQEFPLISSPSCCHLEPLTKMEKPKCLWRTKMTGCFRSPRHRPRDWSLGSAAGERGRGTKSISAALSRRPRRRFGHRQFCEVRLARARSRCTTHRCPHRRTRRRRRRRTRSRSCWRSSSPDGLRAGLALSNPCFRAKLKRRSPHKGW